MTNTSAFTLLVLSILVCAYGTAAYQARDHIVKELPTIADADRPPARRGAASATYSDNGNEVYILFGGVDSSKTDSIILYNDMWMINMTAEATYDQKNWTLISPNDDQPSGAYGISADGYPSGRYGMTMTHDGNQTLLLFGGYSIACTDYCRDIWSYDLVDRKWTQRNSVTDLITDTNQDSLSQYYTTSTTPNTEDFTYASGEYCFTFNTTYNVTVGGNVTVNPNYLKCEESRLGPWKRWHHSMVYNDGAYWLFGGYTVRDGKFLNDVWKYQYEYSQNKSAATGEGWEWVWTEVNGTDMVNVPRARRHHQAVMNNGYMYIFGGYVCCEVQPFFLSDLWRYNFTDNNWSEITGNGTSTPEGRHGFTMLTFEDVLMVFAGYKSPDLLGGSATTDFLSDIWMYNITTNNWILIEQNGESSKIMPPLWETTAQVYFANTTRDSSSVPRKMIGYAPVEHYVFFFGGYNGTTILDSIYRYDQFGCHLDCNAANSSNGECWNNLCLCNVDGTTGDSGHFGTGCQYPKCDTAATCNFDLTLHTVGCVHCAGTGECNTTGYDTVGTVSCNCQDGWTGLDCGTITCSKNCSDVGSCPSSGYECECPMYFDVYTDVVANSPSDMAYEDVCPDDPYYPQELSTVNSTDGSKLYTCGTGAAQWRMYHGSSCETPYCLLNCNDRGRCNHPNCQCQDSYEGMGCQNQVTRGAGSALSASMILSLVLPVLYVLLF